MPPPSDAFNVEGTLLGFLGGEPGKPKAIRLEVKPTVEPTIEPTVEPTSVVIKLPKGLRPYLGQSLQVGDRLRCAGIRQMEGKFKLKAHQVLFGAALSTRSPSPVSPPNPSQEKPANAQKSGKILVCHKSGCQKRGGRKIIAALEELLLAHNLQDQVEIRYTGCQKRCSKAPTLTVMPGKQAYNRLTPPDLAALVEEHFC
ncbi:MAG: (2Fe-2S) ferredoxin domain-containing protein [Leptolyngbya sp. RL_3_1]|nr:(2Fe-2S) ferredoxin domain-containing protein [Leptolyngbya sp. RL_3_1]